MVVQVKDEDGTERPLSVAEYIFYNLAEDGLCIHTPLYRRILDEAVEHAQEEGFEANRYFINHPDPEVAHLAFTLSTDPETLSKLHQQREADSNSNAQDDALLLADTVDHLLCDLKLSVVRQQIKNIIGQVKDPAVRADKTRYEALLTDFKQKKEVERLLAKMCGDRVMG